MRDDGARPCETERAERGLGYVLEARLGRVEWIDGPGFDSKLLLLQLIQIVLPSEPCTMLFSIPSGARACHSVRMLLEVVMETPFPVTTITTAFLLIAELGSGITSLSSIKTSSFIFTKMVSIFD